MRIQKPVIFNTAKEVPAGARNIDTLRSASGELFRVENPSLQKGARKPLAGVWVYYPWLHTAIRIPPEEVYFRLRTARNRDLITEAEQSQYRDCVAGIAGLSVGSAITATLAATGGPRTMKLADPDTIEITNLNRIRAGVPDIGGNKTDVAARRVWELDPFANLHLWRRGIRREDIKEFILGAPRLDVFIDEMDDIALKILARTVCRAARIPVVMATDNGDGVIIDVERFDLEPARPIFHGRIRSPKAASKLSREQFVALSSAIIDPAYFTARQKDSISKIGTQLSGVAQLGSAAAIAGATVAYAVRQIATQGAMPSGRYVLSCEQSLRAVSRGKRAKRT